MLNSDKFCFHVRLNLCTKIKYFFLNFSDQNFSLVIVLSLFLIFGQIQPGCSYKADKVCSRVLGVVNSPMKNEKSRQILPKSRNLAQPSNGSRSFRFCVSRSHICFSIKSLKFSVSVSDFKIPVSASLGFTIRHPLYLPTHSQSRLMYRKRTYS